MYGGVATGVALPSLPLRLSFLNHASPTTTPCSLLPGHNVKEISEDLAPGSYYILRSIAFAQPHKAEGAMMKARRTGAHHTSQGILDIDT